MIEDINQNSNNIEYWKKEYLELSKDNEELLKYKNAWEEIMNFYKVELKDTMSKNDYFVLYKLKEIAKENGIEVSNE